MNAFLKNSRGTIVIDQKVTLTKQVLSFFDFRILGDYSSNFTIPNDSQTRAILNYYGLNQKTPVIISDFDLFINGNKTATGQLVLNEVAETIEAFFMSGNANWVNLVQGSIKDIDLSAYEVDFTADSINERRSATSGVIFPVVDWIYNYKKLSNTFLVKPILGVSVDTYYDLYPCFYVHTILTHLFQQYNITLEGNLFTDPVFKSLIITPEQIISGAYSAQLSGPNGQVESMSVYRPGLSDQDIFTLTKVIMDSGTTAFNNTLDRIVIPATYGAIVNYSAEFKSPNFGTGTIHLYRNGSSVASQAFNNVLSVQAQAELFGSANDYIELFIEAPAGVDIKRADVIITFQNVDEGVVYPSSILPDVAQIEFVKFIVQMFNCIVEFSPERSVLTFSILDRARKENAVDLSSFITSYSIVPRSEYGERNFIRVKPSEELQQYKANDINFGDLLIEGNGEGDRTLFTTPFGGAETATNFNLDWLVTNIPLIRLEDADEGFEINTVQDDAGEARFHISSLVQQIPADSVVRIDTPVYSGFAVVDETELLSFKPYNVPYVNDSTGKMYKQRIVYSKPGSRLLVACSSANLIDFATGSIDEIRLIDNDGSTDYTSAAWAYFAKPEIGTALDNYRAGLHFGAVTGTSTIAVGQLYFRNVSKIVQGQQVKAKLVLSNADYDNLNFAEYVFIKVPDFSGYFFMSNLGGYENGYTEVDLTLMQVNG